MTYPNDVRDRRAFLRLTFGLSAGMLVSACGGGGGSAPSEPVAVVTSPGGGAAAPVQGAGTAAASHPLALPLNLAYLGGNFYGFAAHGAALASGATAGSGAAGSANGGRQAALVDPIVGALAAELAADKAAHVATLRSAIGSAVPAQPAIDLSPRAGGAFSLAAQGAGIVTAGAAFDPYADDKAFLLGAFLIEHATAAAYRTFLFQNPDGGAGADVVANALADAIYHGGAIRSLLDARAQSDGSIDPVLRNAAALFAALDGSNVGDQTLGGASGISADVFDADGVPIPFTRAPDQILKVVYLSSGGVGGFFPAGVNGVAA